MVDFNNLNPFKKKENEFKLDEYSLPSLNDVSTSNSGNDMPSLPSSSNPGPDFSLSSPSDDFPVDMPELPPMGSGLGGGLGASSSQNNNNFNQNPIYQSNPSSNGSNGSNSSIDMQISRAKLESMESKVNLIDARLSNIEQKLEFLSKLILEEISDETKRKLNVQSMVRNFK